jgi:hypothetical protein
MKIPRLLSKLLCIIAAKGVDGSRFMASGKLRSCCKQLKEKAICSGTLMMRHEIIPKEGYGIQM